MSSGRAWILNRLTGNINAVRLTWRRVQFSPFVRDLAFTTFTSVATIVALVGATRLAADGLGPIGFGAYMLARRILATVDPLSTLAMGIAMTRYVALVDERSRHDYLLAGMVLAVGPAAVILVMAWAFSGSLAVLFFRSPAYAPLVAATGLMIFGYSWFTILYGWYRAVGRMSVANAWQLATIALTPLALAAIFRRSGGETPIVWWTGVVLLAAAAPMLAEALDGYRQGAALRRGPVRALAVYGLPRVPGGLAFAGLLAVGPFIAPYFGSLKDVGYVAVGQSILRVVESGTEAFGRVALPKLSRLMAADGLARLEARIADVVAVVFHLGCFATLQLWLWSGEMTRIWLGPQYDDAVPVIRVIVIGVLPYLLFVTLRSIIDAIEEKAVNTTNLYASLAVTVVMALVLARLGYGAVGLAVATTLGFTLLGTLTFAALWRRVRFDTRPLLVPECLALNALLAVAAALARAWWYAHPGAMPLPLAIVVIESLASAAYVAALWKLRARWMGEVTRRVFAEEAVG